MTPQLPPLPAEFDSGTGARLIPGPGAHRATEAETGTTGDEPPGEGRPSADDQPTDRGPGSVTPINRRWYRRPGTYLIAAASAAILATGTIFAVNQFTGPDAQTALEQCIEQAPDREQLRPQAGGGGVTLAPSCAGVLVDVSGLPQLPDDRTYQLWMLTEATNPVPSACCPRWPTAASRSSSHRSSRATPPSGSPTSPPRVPSSRRPTRCGRSRWRRDGPRTGGSARPRSVSR